MTLELNIIGLSGHLGTISVDAQGSLADVKAAIEQGLGVLARGHRLLHGVRELSDGCALGSLPRDGPVDLTLVRRPIDQAQWLGEIEALNWAQVMSWVRSAPEEALADKDVVLAAAAKSAGNVLMYMANDLRTDRRFILELVSRSASSRILEHLPPALKRDEEIALAAIGRDAASFRFVGEELRWDHKFVLAAVTRKGSVLEFVPEALRRDSQIALAAVSSQGTALRFVPRDMQVGLLATAKATSVSANNLRRATVAGA